MAEDPKLAFGVGHTAKLPEHLKPFVLFLDELNKETERGAALVATSYLDILLRKTLVAFLIPNESSEKLTSGFNAPFSTFSAKIAACHAFGLISDQEFKECDILRRVRNRFAHEVTMSFDDQSVSGICANLTLSVPDTNARGQFTSAAVALISNLTNRPHYVGQKSLKFEAWAI
jgi:mannitol operon repressor